MSMNLSAIHVTGNAAAAPQAVKMDESGVLVTLRVAVNHRYRTNDGTWRDGDAMFIEVQCWGQLGRNVLASVCKGTPVLVIGRLIQSTWKVDDPRTGETQNRVTFKIKASHVGVDLNTRRAEVIRSTARREGDEPGQVVAEAGSAASTEGGADAEPNPWLSIETEQQPTVAMLRGA